jgi:ABC-2 type transport system ATP-binding protein
MTAAISTEQLGKTYRVGFFMRKVEGLRDLNLRVEPGEAFGFIGPNGAGKTTTIKILMGLHGATTGSARIFGEDCSHASARRRVGFLPERPYFYEHLTAREVLHFYGQLFEMPKGLRTERMEMLLHRVKLSRFADVTLAKYSKGMLQRVGLCQALLHDPDLIVLDEPMSGLDPVGRALVRDLILEQREAGKTVFFSSHILSDVEAICDRIAILVGGQLRECGALSEVVADRENLEAVLVGEMTKVTDESTLGVL